MSPLWRAIWSFEEVSHVHGHAHRAARQHRVPDRSSAERLRPAGRGGRAGRLRRRLRLQRPPLSAGVAAAAGDRAGDASRGARPRRGEPVHVPSREHRRPRRADRRGLGWTRVPGTRARGMARVPRRRAAAAGDCASRGVRVRASSAPALARAVSRRGLPARGRRFAPLDDRATGAAVPARLVGDGDDPRLHPRDRRGQGRGHRESRARPALSRRDRRRRRERGAADRVSRPRRRVRLGRGQGRPRRPRPRAPQGCALLARDRRPRPDARPSSPIGSRASRPPPRRTTSTRPRARFPTAS